MSALLVGLLVGAGTYAVLTDWVAPLIGPVPTFLGLFLMAVWFLWEVIHAPVMEEVL